MADTKNQGSIENVSGAEAIKKLKELAEGQMCMFCTHDGNRIVSRPMSTPQVDEAGNMWFISSKDSNKNLQIQDDSDVYLTYAIPSKEHYLSVAGTAIISTDKAKIEELWSPFVDAWFEEGKDDPNVSLLRVTPDDCHYWDSKDGKLISMLKIAVRIITGGKNDDGGVEGALKV